MLPYSYRYDGLNRRITQLVDVDLTQTYFSDTWKPLEVRYSGSLLTQYFWGARHRDDLVRRDYAFADGVATMIRYVLMDYFSPAAITDENGDVTERYDFSAFGVRRIMTPTFAPRDHSECNWDFAFQGQFLDRESGLLNYGYRYYAPHLGRWLCKDPLGIFGGTNLYSMCLNQAVNIYDLLGGQPKPPIWPTPVKPKYSDATKGQSNCMGYACTGKTDVEILPKPGQSMKDALKEYGIDCDGKRIKSEAECNCPEGYAKIIFTIWQNSDPMNAGKNGLTDPFRWTGNPKTAGQIPNPEITDPHFWRQEPGGKDYAEIQGRHKPPPTEADTVTPDKLDKRLIDPIPPHAISETYCCCQCPSDKMPK